MQLHSFQRLLAVGLQQQQQQSACCFCCPDCVHVHDPSLSPSQLLEFFHQFQGQGPEQAQEPPDQAGQ
eukprot:2659720-Rhodomonas_salina.1